MNILFTMLYWFNGWSYKELNTAYIICLCGNIMSLLIMTSSEKSTFAG